MFAVLDIRVCLGTTGRPVCSSDLFQDPVAHWQEYSLLNFVFSPSSSLLHSDVIQCHYNEPQHLI